MPRKTHWLFVALIVVIGFITATGILCWQGSIIVRGQQEARQQALAVQTQIYQAHQAKNGQWLTYTNSKYGFEISYPKKYEYKKAEASISPQSKTLLYGVSFLSLTTEEAIKKQNIVAGGSDIAITICDANVIESRMSNKTAIQALADGSWFPGEGSVSDARTKTFLNYPAVEVIDGDRMLNEGKFFEYGYYYYLYVEKGELLYSISFPIFKIGSGQPYESLELEYKEILSAFRFIVDTSDWQTYKNEQYGFEIKYPPTAEEKKWKQSLDGPPLFISLDLPMEKLMRKYFTLDIFQLNNLQKFSDCRFPSNAQLPDLKTEKITLNNIDFCLSIVTEQSLGNQIIKHYFYATKSRNMSYEYLVFYFMVGYPDCKKWGEFPTPQEEYFCQPFNESQEMQVFKEILSTFKFTK